MTRPRRHPFPRRLALLAAAAALATSGAQAASFGWNTGTYTAGVTAPNPLPAGDVLNIGAGGFKYFDGDVSGFTNAGTVNWNADALYLQRGAAVVNGGLWNSTADTTLFFNGGAATSFTNNGIFRKSAGLGSTTINAGTGFVNSGTLEALTGTIAFNGGSSFNAGSVFTGAGVVNVLGGTNTFNGAFSSSNLLLSGGTHLGNGAVVGGASTTFSGGTLAGTWTVGAGQTLTAAGGGFKHLDGVATTLTNQGTLAWNTPNALYLQGGATLRNEALFVAGSSTQLLYNGGAAPTILNTASGTLRAAPGVTLDVNAGAGFVNAGGTLDAAAGASIRFNGGSSFNAGSVFTGAGVVNVLGGTNTFNGAFSSSNLLLSGGTHLGNGAVVGGPSTTFSGGTLAGTWTVGAGQTLTAAGGGFKHLDGVATTLTNQGTLAWNTPNALYLQGGATLRNEALFVAGSSTQLLYNGGAAPTILNTASGTLRAGPGVTLDIGASTGLVNDGGTLDAMAGGAIRYQGGASFRAGSRFTGAGSNVAAGNNSFEGAFSSGNLVLQSGIHTGNAAVAGGSVAFSGGTLAGSWTVAAGQTMTVAPGAFKFLEGAATTLDNQGTLAWADGEALYLRSGATLANAGTLAFGAAGGVFFNGGAATSFVNSGRLVKDGAGTTTIDNGVGFANTGVVDVRSGTLALPFNFVNGGTLTGSGSLSVGGTLTNAGMLAPGASPGTLTLAGNFLQAAGGTLAVELQSLALHDLFIVGGSAALGGTLAISCFGDCSFEVGDLITVLDAVGDLSGSFAQVTLSGFATGAFDVVYDTVLDRVQLQVTQAVTAVPEPGATALWLAGLGVLGFVGRRRRAG